MYGFEWIPLLYPFNNPKAIRITQQHIHDLHGLTKCQEYIEEHAITQAEINTDNIVFLPKLWQLNHMRIIPLLDNCKEYDFSPLYQMPLVQSLVADNQCILKPGKTFPIDYSQIHGLRDLFVRVNKDTKNYQKLTTLQSLRVTGFCNKDRDITNLFTSRELDTLQMMQCGIKCLRGIDASPKIQCVYLSNNRALENISDLSKTSKTLKALRITNCPKIQDFSVLGELTNLELLELTGSNTLPSIDFLTNIPSLKTFVFNMNIEDGDLSPCTRLTYVYTPNRKHYNIRSEDLPKGYYYKGNENIDEWRRLE